MGLFENERSATVFSNELALLAYGRSFRALASNREKMNQIELMSCMCGSALIPLMKSGSDENLAKLAASRQLAERFWERRADLDCVVVVPDNSYLLAPWIDGSCDARSFVDALDEHNSDVRLMLPGLIMCTSPEVAEYVRFFDSHLSPLGYGVLLQLLLRRLLDFEYSASTTRYDQRIQALDLASRFSAKNILCSYPVDEFIADDTPSGYEGVRGMMRRYVNRDAPIDSSILIYGDSHVYSGIAQMLSTLMREVSFVWGAADDWMARKALGDSGWNGKVDLRVEIVSERLFVANFITSK